MLEFLEKQCGASTLWSWVKDWIENEKECGDDETMPLQEYLWMKAGNEKENAMTNEQALEIVIGIACAWGENTEEAFTRRITVEDDDETCRRIAAGSAVEDEDVLGVRDLWRAIKLLNETTKAAASA